MAGEVRVGLPSLAPPAFIPCPCIGPPLPHPPPPFRPLTLCYEIEERLSVVTLFMRLPQVAANMQQQLALLPGMPAGWGAGHES